MHGGRIIHSDSFVLRRVQWKDDRVMLSLLTRNRGLLSASWKIPPTGRRPGREQCPDLFSAISGTLQAVEPGMYRLRSFFSAEPSPRKADLEVYKRLCLLSRAILLTVGESPHEELFHSLWLRTASGQVGGPETLAGLLADFHFAHGTWPSASHCELCGADSLDGLFIRGGALACRSCRSSECERLSPGQAAWLDGRYLRKKNTELLSGDRLALEAMLKLRLPERLLRDTVFLRLMGGVSAAQ